MHTPLLKSALLCIAKYLYLNTRWLKFVPIVILFLLSKLQPSGKTVKALT